MTDQAPSTPQHHGLPPVDKVKLEKQIRGIYSALLILEAIVVLFVPATIRQMGPGLTWPRLTAIGVIILALIALCAFIKKPWAYAAGWVLQICVIAMGFWVWAMFILGAIFAVMWFFAGKFYHDLKARPDYPQTPETKTS
ncbi:uncharacterized protein DUF4233 [Antricoccus suffuscus]|uniref:Uncharacterized protein DUF4233 n=1 Tax=Antricoccus suffuscus TaxID=1629062 RepID=A0A2T0ZVM4_9ACTN|nr:DUF4233 domain-containing protein [Antricoccus suffuscus]PRZ40402.1 uncharacterized protein DUF4233 [Antricoccus suffuscus]